MTLIDYQKQVISLVAKFNFNWSTYVQYIHLVEEVGELGEAITVKEGDRRAGQGSQAMADHSDVKEEVGDVLFNIIALSQKYGFSLDEVLQDTFKRYEGKLALKSKKS